MVETKDTVQWGARIDGQLAKAVEEYRGRQDRTYAIEKALHRLLLAERPDLLDKHGVRDQWP